MKIMWHGSRRWDGCPEVRMGKKGRSECGSGLYLTNSYHTARKYSSGGGSVMRMELKDDIVFADDVFLEMSEVVDFLKKVKGLKNRNEIIEDVRSNANRRNSDKVLSKVLINLFVNYDVSHGKTGMELVKFLVSKGISASKESMNGGEEWIVIMDARKVSKFEKVKSNDVVESEILLKKYKDQDSFVSVEKDAENNSLGIV